MATMREELWNTLRDLTEEQFKEFKWLLQQNDIQVARLEKADRPDTVDLILQKYDCREALKITQGVFTKIDRNDLVKHLSSISHRLTEHKTHESREAEFEREKAKLGADIHLMIQERKRKISQLKRSADHSKTSAGRQISDSIQIFTQLSQSVERTLADLIETIEETHQNTQNQVDGFIVELEKEISELRRRSSEVEKLSHQSHRMDILQSFQSVCPTKSWTEVSVPPPSYEENTRAAVDQLKEKVSEEMEKLLDMSSLSRVRQFSVDVTLDSSTANSYLVLSDDGKQVHCGAVQQNLPENPRRFLLALNVLGKQSFSSGRFYYEVSVKRKTSWDLGVVKESVMTKGSVTASPTNGYWTIGLRDGCKYVANGVHLRGIKHRPNKVGVFVDYQGRIVEFYDADSAKLLHRLTGCCFNERLHPLFSPGLHQGGENSTPLSISPVEV